MSGCYFLIIYQPDIDVSAASTPCLWETDEANGNPSKHASNNTTQSTRDAFYDAWQADVEVQTALLTLTFPIINFSSDSWEGGVKDPRGMRETPKTSGRPVIC